MKITCLNSSRDVEAIVEYMDEYDLITKEGVEGTFHAFITILQESKDEQLISMMMDIFNHYGCVVDLWMYKGFEVIVGDFSRVPKSVCRKIISIAESMYSLRMDIASTRVGSNKKRFDRNTKIFLKRLDEFKERKGIR